MVLTMIPYSIGRKWTDNSIYSMNSCYKALFLGPTTSHYWRLIKKSWGPLSVKVFLWLSF